MSTEDKSPLRPTFSAANSQSTVRALAGVGGVAVIVVANAAIDIVLDIFSGVVSFAAIISGLIFDGVTAVIAYIATFTIGALLGAIGGLFAGATEDLLITQLNPPSTEPQLQALWYDLEPIYWAIITPIGLLYLLGYQLFPDDDRFDLYKYAERVLTVSIALYLTSPRFASLVELSGLLPDGVDMYSAVVYVINAISAFIFPDQYTLSFIDAGINSIAGVLATVVGGISTIVLLLAPLIIGGYAAIVMSVIFFFVMLAFRILFIYAIYALLPVILSFWVMDIGPLKYARSFAGGALKVASILLLMGVIIASILAVSSAVAAGGIPYDDPSDIDGGSAFGNESYTAPDGVTEDVTSGSLGGQTLSALNSIPDLVVEADGVPAGADIETTNVRGTVSTVSTAEQSNGETAVRFTLDDGRMLEYTDTAAIKVVSSKRLVDASQVIRAADGSSVSASTLSSLGVTGDGQTILLQFFSFFGGITLSMTLLTSSLGVLISGRGDGGAGAEVKQRQRQSQPQLNPQSQAYGGQLVQGPKSGGGREPGGAQNPSPIQTILSATQSTQSIDEPNSGNSTLSNGFIDTPRGSGIDTIDPGTVRQSGPTARAGSQPGGELSQETIDLPGTQVIERASQSFEKASQRLRQNKVGAAGVAVGSALGRAGKQAASFGVYGPMPRPSILDSGRVGSLTEYARQSALGQSAPEERILRGVGPSELESVIDNADSMDWQSVLRQDSSKQAVLSGDSSLRDALRPDKKRSVASLISAQRRLDQSVPIEDQLDMRVSDAEFDTLVKQQYTQMGTLMSETDMKAFVSPDVMTSNVESLDKLSQRSDGDRVTVAGEVLSIGDHEDKNTYTRTSVVLGDGDAAVEATLWNGQARAAANGELEVGDTLFVDGNINQQFDDSGDPVGAQTISTSRAHLADPVDASPVGLNNIDPDADNPQFFGGTVLSYTPPEAADRTGSVILADETGVEEITLFGDRNVDDSTFVRETLKDISVGDNVRGVVSWANEDNTYGKTIAVQENTLGSMITVDNADIAQTDVDADYATADRMANIQFDGSPQHIQAEVLDVSNYATPAEMVTDMPPGAVSRLIEGEMFDGELSKSIEITVGDSSETRNIRVKTNADTDMVDNIAESIERGDTVDVVVDSAFETDDGTEFTMISELGRISPITPSELDTDADSVSPMLVPMESLDADIDTPALFGGTVLSRSDIQTYTTGGETKYKIELTVGDGSGQRVVTVMAADPDAPVLRRAANTFARGDEIRGVASYTSEKQTRQDSIGVTADQAGDVWQAGTTQHKQTAIDSQLQPAGAVTDIVDTQLPQFVQGEIIDISEVYAIDGKQRVDVLLGDETGTQTLTVSVDPDRGKIDRILDSVSEGDIVNAVVDNAFSPDGSNQTFAFVSGAGGIYQASTESLHRDPAAVQHDPEPVEALSTPGDTEVAATVLDISKDEKTVQPDGAFTRLTDAPQIEQRVRLTLGDETGEKPVFVKPSAVSGRSQYPAADSAQQRAELDEMISDIEPGSVVTTVAQVSEFDSGETYVVAEADRLGDVTPADPAQMDREADELIPDSIVGRAAMEKSTDEYETDVLLSGTAVEVDNKQLVDYREIPTVDQDDVAVNSRVVLEQERENGETDLVSIRISDSITRPTDEPPINPEPDVKTDTKNDSIAIRSQQDDKVESSTKLSPGGQVEFTAETDKTEDVLPQTEFDTDTETGSVSVSSEIRERALRGDETPDTDRFEAEIDQGDDVATVVQSLRTNDGHTEGFVDGHSNLLLTGEQTDVVDSTIPDSLSPTPLQEIDLDETDGYEYIGGKVISVGDISGTDSESKSLHADVLIADESGERTVSLFDPNGENEDALRDYINDLTVGSQVRAVAKPSSEYGINITTIDQVSSLTPVSQHDIDPHDADANATISTGTPIKNVKSEARKREFAPEKDDIDDSFTRDISGRVIDITEPYQSASRRALDVTITDPLADQSGSNNTMTVKIYADQESRQRDVTNIRSSDIIKLTDVSVHKSYTGNKDDQLTATAGKMSHLVINREVTQPQRDDEPQEDPQAVEQVEDSVSAADIVGNEPLIHLDDEEIRLLERLRRYHGSEPDEPRTQAELLPDELRDETTTNPKGPTEIDPTSDQNVSKDASSDTTGSPTSNTTDQNTEN